jgi:hypothetical protein
VVPFDEHVEYIEHQAREMNCPIRVTHAREYFQQRALFYNRKLGDDRVVFDDLEMCMRVAFGAEVLMITTNGFVSEFNLLDPVKITYTKEENK